MLDLEIQPERSLGNEQWEFILGMPFYQAVHILKKQDTVIKGVQIWYSEQNPLFADLAINLSFDGIRLVFDSVVQRLKIIEVCNLSKVKLRYCGNYFNSTHVSPTIDQINQSFGATHPGVYNTERQLYILNFRGLFLEFKIDPRYEPRYAYGHGPLQFPSGSSPVVTRLLIYPGNSLEEAKTPAMPLSCFHGNSYLESLTVERDQNETKAVRFVLVAEGNGVSKLSEVRRATTDARIKFGDSTQDVLSALGCPSKVFYKCDDKMKIHSASAHKLVQSGYSDYFFNYITLGVDILFDARLHRVKKFVLHSNFPGHYDFNMYYRCEFRVPLGQADKDSGRGDDGNIQQSNDVEISFRTKWNEVSDQLNVAGQKPVVLNRTSTTNTTNPFGATFCYGVQDMIFEVMHNHHIAAVTLYQARSSAG